MFDTAKSVATGGGKEKLNFFVAWAIAQVSKIFEIYKKIAKP